MHVLDETSHLAVLLFALLDKMLARRPAALAADDLIASICIRLAYDEIVHDAARQLDAVRQLLDFLDAVDFSIGRIRVQLADWQAHCLVLRPLRRLAACVRHQARDIKHISSSSLSLYNSRV